MNSTQFPLEKQQRC